MIDVEPLALTEIRLRTEVAEASTPKHRRTPQLRDVRILLGMIDGLRMDLGQTREAKDAMKTTNHICRDHHALYHRDCTEGGPL